MEISKLCVNCFNEKKQGDKCTHCDYNEGDLAKNEMHLLPGTVLKGQYIVGRVLGYGGFGVTYLAYDLNLQTIRAIKEYLPGELSVRSSDGLTIHSYSGEAADNYKYGLNKFIEEGRMLARYSNVITIVSVYDFFHENNTAYLVMEYLDGENLSEYTRKKGGKLSVDEALRLIEPIFDALNVIHSSGMIHRDISPDNIFITKTGDTKLLDFGTARFAMCDKSKSLSVILKPGFSPPEQYFSRGKQGPWTDIYALAASIYRLIKGNNPPDSIERQTEEIIDLSNDFDVNIPNNVKLSISKALSLKSSDRQKSILEFKKQLYKAKEIAREEVNHNDNIILNRVETKNENTNISNILKAIKKRKKLLTIIVSAFGIIAIITIITTPDKEDNAYNDTYNKSSIKVTATTTPRPTTRKTPKPTATRKPTATPKPTANYDPVGEQGYKGQMVSDERTIPIHLWLEVHSNGEIIGTYYYDKWKTYIDLYGKKTSSTYKIDEYYNGEITGHFSISPSQDGRLHGKWYAPDRKTQFTVELTPIYN